MGWCIDVHYEINSASRNKYARYPPLLIEIHSQTRSNAQARQAELRRDASRGLFRVACDDSG